MYAVLGRLSALLLPHQCVSCRLFAETTGLCTACWTRLSPVTAPFCQHYERGVYAPDLLIRHRATKSQGGLSRQARKRNLTGAFIPSSTAPQTLRGHPVLLVDDVMTTGATLQAATSCLRRAGAGEIRALTIARVI